MYPPSAAAMLAWLSMLGPFGSLLTLLLVNSAAWAFASGCRSGCRLEIGRDDILWF